MLPERIDDITLSHVNALLDAGTTEGARLDYKQARVGSADKDKVEFLTDVASFANASGGDIIFGVTEARGAAIAIDGLTDVTDADKEILRLNSIIMSGIEPRIPVQIRAIAGGTNGPIIVVRVPRSWFGLHMVKHGGGQRFYGRSNAGKVPLDVQQIRAGFVGGAEIISRAREFRDERLSRLMSGETPVALSVNRAFVAHFIPASAISTEAQVDVKVARRSAQVLAFAPTSSDLRYNIDGLIAEAADSYTTLYRSGILETASAYLLKNPTIPSFVVAERLAEATQRYIALMGTLGLTSPAFLFGSLYGVRGHVLAVRAAEFASAYYERKFDRDVILLPDVLIEDVTLLPTTIVKPMLDGLWQAGGAEACDYYDEQGNWVGLRR